MRSSQVVIASNS